MSEKNVSSPKAGPRVEYWQTIRKSLVLLRGARRLFGLVLAVQVVAALLHGVADPLALKFLIDSLQRQDLQFFLMLSVVLLVVYTGFRYFSYLAALLTQKLKNEVLRNLFEEMISHYYGLPYNHLLRHDRGYFMSRIYEEPTKTSEIVDLLVNLFATITVALGAIIVCLYLSWEVSLFLAFVLPLLFFLADKFGRRIRVIAIEENEDEAQLRGGISRAVESYKNVRLFSLQASVLEVLRGKVEKFLSTTLERLRLAALFQMISSTLLSYAEMSVLIGVGFLVLRGQLTVGGLFAFMAAYWRVVNSVRSLGNLLPALAKAASYLDRFEEFEELTVPVAGERARFSRDANVELRSVSVSYDGENDVLSDLDFIVKPGERILVTGGNGSGKSTMAHVLAGLLGTRSGNVIAPGLERTSAAFSDGGFVPGIAFDSLGYDLLSETKREWADRLIERYELKEVIGRDPASFSDGQKKKLQIIMALLKDADLYIFDEPLASVDELSKEKIIQDILATTKLARLVVVLHGDEKLWSSFDRRVDLSNMSIETAEI